MKSSKNRRLVLFCFFAFLLAVANGEGQTSSAIVQGSKPEEESFTAKAAMMTWDTSRLIRTESDYMIRLFSLDGFEWMRFSPSESHPEHVSRLPTKSKLAPIFPTQYLTFLVVAESPTWWRIEVDYRNGLTKYIRKGDAHYLVSPLEETILSASSIEVDVKSNPIKDSPGGKALVLNPDDRLVVVTPVGGIQEDWLQVEVRTVESSQKRMGWVRWKQKNTLLVRFALLPRKVYSRTSRV